MRRHRRASWLLATTVTLGATAIALGGETAPGVTHLASRTVAETGRTRVIHFVVDPPSDEEQVLDASVSDETVLAIVRPATVLAHERLGTIRVRGGREGEALLTIGDAGLPVRVVGPRAAAADDRHAPRIVGPSSGAVLWGRVTIGVEVRLAPGRPLRHVAVNAGRWLTLLPDEDTGATCQPYRQLRFTLDTAAVPEGPLELRAVATGELREQVGEAVRVRVIRLDRSNLIAGEAESKYELSGDTAFGGGDVTVARDPGASGGRYAVNTSAAPAVSFPISVRRPGWYQMMVVGRGTRAQSVLPMVAVLADGTPEPLTNGRLFSERWHRVAVGIPFRLEPGRHVLTPLFANDFYVEGLADRNLHLDRIEVARVGYADPVGPGRGTASDDDAGAGAERQLDDPLGLFASPMRIGLARAPHGVAAPGALDVEARVWRRDDEHERPPAVTAVLNGRPIQTQWSREPRFTIDPTQLRPGTNRLQLVARDVRGPVAATPVQEIRWDGEAAASPRRIFRYTVDDERWSRTIRPLRRDHPGSADPVAAFHARRAVVLDLPEELVGAFDVELETWAASRDVEPVVSVSLDNRGGTRELGRIAPASGWSTERVARVEIPYGQNRLIVRLDDVPAVAPEEDPHLALKALVLVETRDAPDAVAPAVALRYPPSGHAAHLADAVVAVASDDVALRHAELLVDDRPTGQVRDLRRTPGEMVFPLLLRGLAPGPHSVAVRVTDEAGNQAVSEPRIVRVLAAAPDEPGEYARAVRLLNRFAFGPDPGELGTILAAGEAAWLERSLRRSFADPAELAALGAVLPAFPGLGQGEVTGRVLAHLVRTPNPARARFVLWAENHFSTWIRKTGPEAKWREHVAFSRLGAAPFDWLLRASAESPAMIAYLDQAQSYVGRLNENYAREIMELHTVGVDGGYAQSDVTNLARLLTGWTASLDGDGRSGGAAARRSTFRFDPRLNDGAGTQVFGVAFTAADGAERYDRAVLAVEHLAAHPMTARYIARKIVQHYVTVPAPEPLVAELAEVFMETGGDMAALLTALAAHEALLAAEAPSRVAQPLDYVIRLLRVTGHQDPWRARQFLQTSGCGLFDHPTPDGYPEEDARYVGNHAMVQRWRLALDLTGPLAAMVPAAWRGPGDPADEAWAQSTVDVIAVRLTGRVLSEASNEAALDVLAAAEGTREARVRVVAPFIALLPEVNLR